MSKYYKISPHKKLLVKGKALIELPKLNLQHKTSFLLTK